MTKGPGDDVAAGCGHLSGKAVASDPVRARAKKAAAWGGYGIILPGIFAAVIVPSYANIAAVIATTAVVYFAFWLIGSFIMLANAEW
jgi:hypothetical protein